jgi:hypothetical protein
MHFFCTNECKSLGGWGVVPDYGGFKWEETNTEL